MQPVDAVLPVLAVLNPSLQTVHDVEPLLELYVFLGHTVRSGGSQRGVCRM